ncbi:hypothetical protein AB4Z52_09845 [Rhizobium sp. 2YAF20]|uniref:hypothetical protein n=1 Tax=Rhizobium sp. 2YAF20 TaxID=3233027 RepID=UPI003F9B5080
MVSALSNTRMIAAQMALQVLMTSSDDSSSQDSSSSTPGSGDISSLPSSSQASLTSILNSMSASQSTTTSTSSSDVASTDITTSSFMALLKQNLTATAKKNEDGGQAQAMLDALANGTLTVNDPASGVSITAWDPSASTDAAATTTDGTSKSGTAIPVTDWNDYLKAHLARSSNGTFSRTSDGSFIDKESGKDAYFGQVGSQFYYLTYPSSSTVSGATTASGTASANATDTQS